MIESLFRVFKVGIPPRDECGMFELDVTIHRPANLDWERLWENVFDGVVVVASAEIRAMSQNCFGHSELEFGSEGESVRQHTATVAAPTEHDFVWNGGCMRGKPHEEVVDEDAQFASHENIVLAAQKCALLTAKVCVHHDMLEEIATLA